MAALKWFAFLLLFGQVVVATLNWLARQARFELPRPLAMAIGPAMAATAQGYFNWACRNAHRNGRGDALAGLAAVLSGVLFANIVVYRALQFVMMLALALDAA